MKILAIWFLMVDEWLHASALLRDLEAIALRGYQVVGLFPVLRKIPGTNCENFRISAVRLGHFVPLLSYFWFCLAAITRIIRGGRDAEMMVFEVDEYPLAVPWLLRRLLTRTHRPMLAVRDFTPLDEFHGVQRFYRSLLRHISLLLSRFSDAVFVISPMLGREICAKYGISPDRIHVWPSSVDTDFFDPSKYGDDRKRIRKELGLADRFLLIHHGYLSEERGLYELLEATRIAHEDEKSVALLLLGKGPAADGARAFVRSSGLDDAVIFRDPVPAEDVPRFIAAADAGVHPLPNQPQWRVQTPTKVLEYLSMRKPVIVTDIPANRWIVGNRPVAFFCGDGHPQEIAEAILRCVRARSSIPETERREITARFSPDSLAQRLVEVLDDACARSANDLSVISDVG